MPVFKPDKFLSVLLPPVALLPEFPGLDKWKQNLNRSSPVHLLPDDRLHFSDGPQPKRKIRVNARGQFSDHPCSEHQLMARDFCLGRDLFQSGK
jgi:hypothetical protein